MHEKLGRTRTKFRSDFSESSKFDKKKFAIFKMEGTKQRRIEIRSRWIYTINSLHVFGMTRSTINESCELAFRFSERQFQLEGGRAKCRERPREIGWEKKFVGGEGGRRFHSLSLTTIFECTRPSEWLMLIPGGNFILGQKMGPPSCSP